MAAEAEAAREARAKVGRPSLDSLLPHLQVIAADGEQKAARALKEAADVINVSPAALQLRFLQVLKINFSILFEVVVQPFGVVGSPFGVVV